MDDQWITDRAQLCDAAQMLAEAGYLDSAQDVVDFLEKPWKWQDERALWLEAGSPLSDTEQWALFAQRLKNRDDNTAIS